MNYKKLIKTQVGLLALLAGLSVQAESNLQITGYWTGNLTYRGDPLAVRVAIDEDDRQEDSGHISAYLDIPSLVYAHQAIPARCCDDGVLSLEFPFGVGNISVEVSGEEKLRGETGDFLLELSRADPPKFSQTDFQFGATSQKLNGTLFLPSGKGPHGVVVVVAGSGNSSRSNWSYSSWADYYLNQGLGAFIYDRRPDLEALPDGSVAGIQDHAADVIDALRQISLDARVDKQDIGLAGHSRGGWIAMSVVSQVPDLAFLVLISSAAATPGEQEATSVLTGMRQDGVSEVDLSNARAYLRLYFYVAQTGEGWDLLESAIKAGADSNWLQYVDQPRNLDDLRWWKANMNFAAAANLENVTAPVIALWGGDDFITPWAEYRGGLESVLQRAGNSNVSSKVYAAADHRLEIGYGEDENNNWHWFGLAPGVLDDIGRFLQRTTQP
jgi:pimeloyl-ACP methyl ester carboxylesterase